MLFDSYDPVSLLKTIISNLSITSTLLQETVILSKLQ